MEKITEWVERYHVTMTDNAYPVTVERKIYSGVDLAVAKSIARHYNKKAPECVSYAWGHEGVDYDRALYCLTANGWTKQGAEEYLDKSDLRTWTYVDLQWICNHIEAR